MEGVDFEEHLHEDSDWLVKTSEDTDDKNVHNNTNISIVAIMG